MAQIQNDPKESQKPEKVIQGMIQGRINKELKEICLLDQVYVKAEDGKQSVAQYVAQVAKANNATVAVKGFVRFETGEGIEKKLRKIISEYLQRSLRKMTGYSVNLHICIMGGQDDRLSFKEKEGRLVLIYQSAYIYIHTHIFLHIIFLLSTVSYR